MLSALRIAPLLLFVWSFSAWPQGRELECLPPIPLDGFIANLKEGRPELSLDWNSLQYLRRHKDYQVHFSSSRSPRTDQVRHELNLKADCGLYRFETQILPRFHRIYDVHLVYMDGPDHQRFMRHVPQHNLFYDLFYDGAMVFEGRRSAYILARNYHWLSVCIPLPRGHSRGYYEEVLGRLFAFVNNPSIIKFLSCEALLTSAKMYD